MTSVERWARKVEREVAGFGRLAALYVRCGDDLVEVGAPRGRRLATASALGRALASRPGPLLGADERFPAAILEELGAERALLVHRGEDLVAVACLSDLADGAPLDEAAATRLAARCADAFGGLDARELHAALDSRPRRRLPWLRALP